MRMKARAAWKAFKSNYDQQANDNSGADYLPEAIVANRDRLGLVHPERFGCDEIRECINIIERLRHNTSISHELEEFSD